MIDYQKAVLGSRGAAEELQAQNELTRIDALTLIVFVTSGKVLLCDPLKGHTTFREEENRQIGLPLLLEGIGEAHHSAPQSVHAVATLQIRFIQ